MNDVKPWYLSRTIWAALVTVAVGVLGLFGVSTGEVGEAELTDAIIGLVTAVAGFVAIAGRLAARDRIG